MENLKEIAEYILTKALEEGNAGIARRMCAEYYLAGFNRKLPKIWEEEAEAYHQERHKQEYEEFLRLKKKFEEGG